MRVELERSAPGNVALTQTLNAIQSNLGGVLRTIQDDAGAVLRQEQELLSKALNSQTLNSAMTEKCEHNGLGQASHTSPVAVRYSYRAKETQSHRRKQTIVASLPHCEVVGCS